MPERSFAIIKQTHNQIPLKRQSNACMPTYIYYHAQPKCDEKKMSMGQFFDSASYFFHEET